MGTWRAHRCGRRVDLLSLYFCCVANLLGCAAGSGFLALPGGREGNGIAGGAFTLERPRFGLGFFLGGVGTCESGIVGHRFTGPRDWQRNASHWIPITCDSAPVRLPYDVEAVLRHITQRQSADDRQVHDQIPKMARPGFGTLQECRRERPWLAPFGCGVGRLGYHIHL